MESSIEDLVCDRAEADGWLVRKLSWVGRRGGPDRFFLKNVRVVLMEFKDHDRGVEGQQSKEIQRLIDHGAEIYVTSNPRQALRYLGIRL